MRKMQFRVLLLALLLCGIGIVLFLWLHPKQKPAANSLPVFYRLPEESDRQAFLTEQHYTLHSGNAVRSCPVLIPDENENSSVYQSYWKLQTEQKLPLSAFCGCQGIEYTYSLQMNAFLFYCQRMEYCWQRFAMIQQTHKPYCRLSNQVKLPNHRQRLCLALCSLHHTKHNQRNDTNRHRQLNQTGKYYTDNWNHFQYCLYNPACN